MTQLQDKKAVLIIASRNFRDEEFAEPYALLKAAGVTVTIASSRKEPSKGMLGKIVTPEILVRDIKPADYDAVVFIGGQGAQEYFKDPTAQTIARDTVKGGKLLAAICIAPVTLANAGVLKGKNATCFPSMQSVLSKAGAKVIAGAVVRDGKIITATGPEAAGEFGRSISAALAE